MENKLKKILILGVALMMCLGLFAGCGDEDYGLDISGKSFAG